MNTYKRTTPVVLVMVKFNKVHRKTKKTDIIAKVGTPNLKEIKMNEGNKCIAFVEMSLSNRELHIIVGTRNSNRQFIFC